jgi:soluble lytic murein transglycosylase-like protein
MKWKALPASQTTGYNRKNRTMSFCLALLALTVPSAVPAAEPPVRAKSTVRVARSGQLVRSMQMAKSTRTNSTQPPPEIAALVQHSAARHEVDPLLVQSVMRVESNFDPLAVSPKGAMGLMQLIPATARRFGATNAFDPRDNIEAGVKYLRYLKDLLQDDRLALAAYNAGEGAVLRHGGVPPYQETQEYVKRVQQQYDAARIQPGGEKPRPREAAPAQPAFRSVELFTDEQGRIHLRTRE